MTFHFLHREWSRRTELTACFLFSLMFCAEASKTTPNTPFESQAESAHNSLLSDLLAIDTRVLGSNSTAASGVGDDRARALATCRDRTTDRRSLERCFLDELLGDNSIQIAADRSAPGARARSPRHSRGGLPLAQRSSRQPSRLLKISATHFRLSSSNGT